jgi:hypothetical protein
VGWDLLGLVTPQLVNRQLPVLRANGNPTSGRAVTHLTEATENGEDLGEGAGLEVTVVNAVENNLNYLPIVNQSINQSIKT